MGLAKKTLEWYLTTVEECLREHKRLTLQELMMELRRRGHVRYPLNKGRVVAILQILRALGRVQYDKGAKCWEIC